METGATAVVGRGIVEILPDFKKWGQELAANMKVAKQQALSQIAPIEGATRDAQGRLRDANGRFIKEYENGWKGASKTVLTSMASVGKGTTALGVGVAAVSVKMAADFQSHTAVLQTAAGETAKGLQVVREGIKNIAVGTGTSLDNLTDGMYTVEKAGYRGAAGLQVLKAAAQGAREENAKLSDVTNAMTSVMASYHLKATDSTRVMNAMKTAAGEGKITMEEFSGALSTVLPIASANKISFEDVAGSMATLTQHGTSAREATHELAATIRALASPNLVASREMTRFGLDANDVSTKLGQRGLSGTVNLLVETILSKMGPAGTRLQKIFEGTKQSSQDAQVMLQHMSGDQKKLAQEYLKGDMILEDWNSTLKGMPVSAQPALRNFKVLVDRSKGFSRELKNGGPATQTFTDALKKMSGGAIGLNTILQITGESAAGNAERIKKVGESFHNSSKDVEGWKVTSKLLNVQLDRTKMQMKVLAIDIGTKLIPVVSAVVGLFAAHRGILTGLVTAILAFVVATSAAYIATKLWWTWTKAVALAQGIATAATFAWTVATMAQTDSLLALRAQLVLLAIQERVTAIATAIASSSFWALTAAMLANPMTWIVIAVVALVAGIVLLATKTRFFQTIWAATWGFVKTVFLGFYHWFKSNWQLITFTIMTLGIGLAVAMIVRHWKTVKATFVGWFNWVKDHWKLLLAIITGPIGLAVYMIVKYWSQISDGAQAAYHATVNWFIRMGKDIGHFFTSTLPGFFQALPGEIADAFSSSASAVGNFASTAWKAISSFFSKLPGQLATWGKQFYQANLDAGKQLIAGLLDGATTFFTKQIPSFFKMLWHGIVDYFKAVFGIHSPSTVMADLGTSLMQGLFGGMLQLAKTAGDWLKAHVYTPVVNFFVNAGSWLYNQGKSFISGLIRGWLAIAQTFNTWMTQHIYRPVINFFTSAGSWLYNAGRNIIYGQIRGLAAIASTLGSWFTSHVRNPIVGFFSNAGSWLYNHGRDVISGLYSGFVQKWKDAISWVRSLKDKVVSAVVSVFKIGSPAKTMIPLGVHIIAGLMKGMLSSKGALKTVVKSIFHSASDVMKRGGKLLGDVIGDLGGALGLGTPSAKTAAEQWAQTYIKAKYGWAGPQWAALYNLWMGESGWNASALNKSSGAYGIPQSLPASKMASAGSDWRTNPATQIKWGTNYIKSRYGNPVNAYAKWLARNPHWYDSGGIAKGIGALMKNTNKPERVLSPRQTVAFENLVGALTSPQQPTGSTLVIDKLVIDNHGVIGSRQEVEDWLVSSLTSIKRKGRMP